MIRRLLALSLVLLLIGPEARAQQPLPIIDMHLHAMAADDNGPPPLAICVPFLSHLPPLDPKENWGDVFIGAMKKPSCPNPIWSPTTEKELLQQTVEVLQRRNIIGILSGTPERVLRWSRAAPDRFFPSVQFRIGREDISPEAMRRLFAEGRFVTLAEISNQYAGIGPDDERMEPYWALAEELDIPVGIHMGEGPPGGAHLFPDYRVHFGNPLLLEDVLHRHPKLRLWVMHYGSPMMEEMIALLQSYPQVYVDISPNQWRYPRAYFYSQLRTLVDAGFGKRVMYGSDQMNWPGVIEPAVAAIEEAPFLSEEQKRDILYNNAARFLRLSEEQIARHHGRQ
ncbi:MAG: amidohydrolase family protein [Sphingomicrobium sp.]